MNLQIDSHGNLKHFLSIEDLEREHLLYLIKKAKQFLTGKELIKNIPPVLQGKTVANLFFEASTRTRCSFEIAAKRLGAHVINFASSQSSTLKGETLLDTARTLAAMGVDCMVIRHAENGAPETVAREFLHHLPVINAGDGTHEHPTQALLDMLTISLHELSFEKLSVAIIGDIAHSRVARSDVQALIKLGTTDIRLIGPESFIPDDLQAIGARAYSDLQLGVRGADVIIALRIQRERMQEAEAISDAEYYRQFGVTTKILSYAKPNVLVMHPGPINRGVEIESAVADGPRSVILEQVSNGVAARMAVLQTLLG